MLLPDRPVSYYREDLGLGRYLAIYRRDAAHFLYLAPDPESRDLEPERVAGNDRASESGIIDAREKRYLVSAILKFAQGEYRSDLSKRLYLQHARHHGHTRKMALKKIFVRCHLFDADDPHTGLELDYAVDQQKRIAMRQNLLNRNRIENSHKSQANKKHKPKAGKMQFRRPFGQLKTIDCQPVI